MPPRKKRKVTANKESGKAAVATSKKPKKSAPQPKENGKTEGKDTQADKPVYTHWLMKSEPESRFENGVDMKIVKSGYPDHTQFDRSNSHYDGSSKADNPKWYMVDVKYKAPLSRFVTLSELKRLHQEHAAKGGPLKNMALFTRARLSVQPVSKEEWDYIIELSKTKV